MIRPRDLSALACPSCRAALGFVGETQRDRLCSGALVCEACKARFVVERGRAQIVRKEGVTGRDKWMQRVYDAVSRVHDPLVKSAFVLLEQETEGAVRERYMPRLELSSLAPRADGRPLRVLDVGIGAGGSLPLVRRGLPKGLDVELWGCDLSAGMLDQLSAKLAREEDPALRSVQADAHALPFATSAFDRVFHVGAMNSYQDPRAALSEMARVAAPGSPIVVVDEQLDRSRPSGWYHRAAFRMVTFYDRDPHCPVELLPESAYDVRQEAISRFFYCLTFRVG